MAAIQAVLLAFPQGVVVLPDDLYHGVVTLIDQVLAPWGMRVIRYAADGGIDAVVASLDEAIALASSKAAAASTTTTSAATFGVGAAEAASKVLLWMETPSNPLLRIVDIQAACHEARKRGVATAVDATWLTPMLCRPLELGADVVVHSVSPALHLPHASKAPAKHTLPMEAAEGMHCAVDQVLSGCAKVFLLQVTKYLAGHSDVLAGVVVAAARTPKEAYVWQEVAAKALDPRAVPVSASPTEAASAEAASTATELGEPEAGAAACDLPTLEKAGDAVAVGWWPRVRAAQRAGGGVAGPFECFLALRGLRTLSVRMRQQCANAMALARALEAHPGVEAVFYPGLESHPQHELAKSALFADAPGDGQKLFGAMLSVRIVGGEAAALRVASALRVFHTATSLGGTESLVEHRATIEPKGSTTPRDLLRVSVGLEPATALIADWVAALGNPK